MYLNGNPQVQDFTLQTSMCQLIPSIIRLISSRSKVKQSIQLITNDRQEYRAMIITFLLSPHPFALICIFHNLTIQRLSVPLLKKKKKCSVHPTFCSVQFYRNSFCMLVEVGHEKVLCCFCNSPLADFFC